MHKIIFHQMMKNTITNIINEFTRAKDLTLTVLTNQIFLNHTHKTNKYDNLEIIQHLTTTIFNNKIQLTQNYTNQLKCILKFHCQIVYTTRNNKKPINKFLSNATCRRITTNDYELYQLGESSITSNKPLMAFTGTDLEYSLEDYLNAVTAKLILNIGPEPVNTPLHQNWIHRRTALTQTTLDGAAQK